MDKSLNRCNSLDSRDPYASGSPFSLNHSSTSDRSQPPDTSFCSSDAERVARGCGSQHLAQRLPFQLSAARIAPRAFPKARTTWRFLMQPASRPRLLRRRWKAASSSKASANSLGQRSSLWWTSCSVSSGPISPWLNRKIYGFGTPRSPARHGGRATCTALGTTASVSSLGFLRIGRAAQVPPSRVSF